MSGAGIAGLREVCSLGQRKPSCLKDAPSIKEGM